MFVAYATTISRLDLAAAVGALLKFMPKPGRKGTLTSVFYVTFKEHSTIWFNV